MEESLAPKPTPDSSQDHLFEAKVRWHWESSGFRTQDPREDMGVEEAGKREGNPMEGAGEEEAAEGILSLASCQGRPSEPPTMSMTAATYQLTPLCQQSRSRSPELCGERQKLG